MRRILILSALICSTLLQAQNNLPLRAIYHTPATNWESEALPIGNGYMGAMIYGTVNTELIQTNEKTLWSGGPGEDSQYNGGHLRTAEENHQTFLSICNILQEKAIDFSNNRAAYVDANGKLITHNYDDSGVKELVDRFGGDRTHFGSYQTLSNILINDPDIPELIKESIKTSHDNLKNKSQTIAHLFDGNIGNKWFADHENKPLPVTIEWAYNRNVRTNTYSVTSADDMPGRDPKAWKLYASGDGKNYRLVDEQSGIFWPESAAGKGRRQTKTFPMKKGNYRFFKLVITELVDNSQQAQLSEFSLNLPNSYSHYTRTLDLDNALQTVVYKQGKNQLKREYFMSYPDRVMVIRLTGSKPFNKIISLDCPHKTYSISANEKGFTLTGYPTPLFSQENPNWRNGLRFAQQLILQSTDGKVTAEGGKLRIERAREIVLLMSAATNYRPCYDKTFNYLSPEDPLHTVESIIGKARAKTYQALLDTHLKDYHALYNRMSLQLGNAQEAPAEPTDSLLYKMTRGTATPAQCRYLETLYYQMGRYLLISSSRPGSLPANLQGVWGERLQNPWNADYHSNINIEMNYWPAEPTNLSECHLPMIDFVRSLVPRGEQTANHYYCKPDGGKVRGWIANHEINIWGHTAPAPKGTPHVFPQGAIWMCQDIWEHYLFTQNKEFLKENFPILLGAALFWVDNLWTDQRDGSLVCNPSLSPEHGEFSLGCSTAQAMVSEIFHIILQANSELKQENTSEIQEIQTALQRLSGPKIGLGGQFMEWKDEVTRDITGDNHHRHTNHLFWLHPGTQIKPGRSEEDNRYAEAMKVTLNTRGDGGTGWSKAWKLNFWARLLDGDRAHKLLKSAMQLTHPGGSGGVYANLFDAHPPFQIDGNFGVTAGVAEMLLQSHGGYIELLPALPSEWSEGSFNGMCARGGVEVSAQWSNGRLTKAILQARQDGTYSVKYRTQLKQVELKKGIPTTVLFQ